jgi:hypothetical protein
MSPLVFFENKTGGTAKIAKKTNAIFLLDNFGALRYTCLVR